MYHGNRPLPSILSRFFLRRSSSVNWTSERSSGYGQPGAFETPDFYLTCFLRCTGYNLLDLRAEGRRWVFAFKDRPERRDHSLLRSRT
jgi:hypothetical protein